MTVKHRYRIRKGKGMLITVFFLLLFGAAFFFLSQPSPKDYCRYRELAAIAKPTAAGGGKRHSYQACQHRVGIRKDLFIPTKTGIAGLEITSATSELVFSRDDDHHDMIEKLKGVCCLMQEQCFYRFPDGTDALADGPGAVPMQYIRMIEGDEATYSYTHNTLAADHASVKRFLLPGHRLLQIPDDAIPVLVGTADHVLVTITEGIINFSADNFNMQRLEEK
ncbi:MAG: hypothetical protein H7A37_01425 [Chlamydiales bacterium]|nr:hypothetical protein [Chlamydiia bacterium]MCP5506955.1 hypothetical protein [Chlamydiales bacterium]